MSVIFILIAVSLFVAICFLIAFFWAVRSGQYEDDYTPSVRMLFEDEKIENIKIKDENHTSTGSVDNQKNNSKSVDNQIKQYYGNRKIQLR